VKLKQLAKWAVVLAFLPLGAAAFVAGWAYQLALSLWHEGREHARRES
jgi:hypothetical protein